MNNLSVSPLQASCKPNDNTLVVSAREIKITQGRNCDSRIELIDADLGDILEQIGFEAIFDYWSLEMVRMEVERYAVKHPDEDEQSAVAFKIFGI